MDLPARSRTTYRASSSIMPSSIMASLFGDWGETRQGIPSFRGRPYLPKLGHELYATRAPKSGGIEQIFDAESSPPVTVKYLNQSRAKSGCEKGVKSLHKTQNYAIN